MICECTALMSPNRAKQPYMQKGSSQFTVPCNTSGFGTVRDTGIVYIHTYTGSWPAPIILGLSYTGSCAISKSVGNESPWQCFH